MTTTAQEIIITLLGGTFLLLFLVVIVIVAATRYQNRKRHHLMDIQRLKFEAEQELLKSRLEVQEKTLTEVSREIHDNIGQILSVVKLNLHTLKPTETKMISQVGGTIDLVNRAITDLRNLSKILNSDFISQQTLSALLQREIDVINRAQAFSLDFKLEGEELPLSPDKQLIIFRIAQECLQNAIKHSKATHISVLLAFGLSHCKLSIRDNGVGFVYDLVKNGNGFTNLKARTSIINADFEVKSEPNLGSVITLTIPVQ